MRILTLVFCVLTLSSPLLSMGSATDPTRQPGIIADTGPTTLPARYFWLMESATDQVEARLKADPNATLSSLDEYFKSIHFPFSILAPPCFTPKSIRTIKGTTIPACWRSPCALATSWRRKVEQKTTHRARIVTGKSICGSKRTGYC